jgi:TolA-binding protein
MQIDKNNIALMTEKLLNNAFSTEEETMFKHILKNDEALNHLSEIHRDAILVIELASIKKELKNKYNEEKVGKNNTKRSYKNYWKIYLGIAVSFFMLIGLNYYFSIYKPNYNTIYKQYFYKDEGLPITMGELKSKTYTEAMNAYKTNNYIKAQRGFEQLLNENRTNDTTLYYLAMTYFYQNQTSKAQILLNEVVIQKETVFYQQAKYFLALLYISKNEIENAKKILENCKHERANELFKKLK